MTRFLPLLMALAACETVITIDPPDYEAEIAATSLFTPDSVWTARISRTIPIEQTGTVDSPFLDNASVSVWEGDQLVDRLVYDNLGAGIYRSRSGRTPEPNKLYRLEVEAPGYGRVEATSALPVAPQITELSLELQSGVPSSRPWYNLRFRLKDSPDAAFYSFGAYLVYTPDPEDGGDSEDIQIEPLSMAQEDPAWQCSYERALNPVQIDSDGGATEWCSTGIMADRQFSGMERDFETTIVPRYSESAREPAIIFYVNSMSEDYFEYQRSLENSGYQDPFSEPLQIFTNVEGGRGVFGGYNSFFRILELPDQ
ncbi:MAG: DUF4249 domain-containing protein [Rhodothermaceae bacterium]|nr:DUF4249 domain-containing protein [Rhodothermaceae bacterium]